MEDIERKVYAYITEELAVEFEGVLDHETSLIEEGVIDSIGLFRLVAFLEEAFAVRVRDEDLKVENFMSIRRIIEYVQEHLDKTYP